MALVFTILPPEPPVIFDLLRVHQTSSLPLIGFPHFISSGYTLCVCLIHTVFIFNAFGPIYESWDIEMLGVCDSRIISNWILE